MRKENIFRIDYFKKIEPYIGDNLIKVLTGQRRVGKSYILFQIMDEIKKRNSDYNIIYINKEDYKFDSIKTYVELMTFVESMQKDDLINYLFIDEIQEIDEFEKALRSLQLKNNFDIYITGSNATLLSGELSSFLAGRFIKIRIFSLSYKEFLLFNNLLDCNDSLLMFIKFGGMPHLINLNNNPHVYTEYLNNIFDSIVLRDIISRFRVRNVNFLRNLISFIADNIGSLVSAKRISDYLKSQNLNLSPKVILEYLYYFETVYAIDRVKRIEVGGRKIFETGDKFYFEDMGIRNALIPYSQKDISKILENLVYHQLKILQYDVYIGKLDDKEIDFVAKKDNRIVYIQVAYLISNEKTHNREFGNLLKIPDSYQKMVISMDELIGNNYKGIQHWSVRRFLLEFE